MEWRLVRGIAAVLLALTLFPSSASSQTMCPPCCRSATCLDMDACTSCCMPCTRTPNFAWPVVSNQFAENPLRAICNQPSGGIRSEQPYSYDAHQHFGLDLLAQEGEQVYAAFKGFAKQFNETDDEMPGYYKLGCAVQLESEEKASDGKHPRWIAYYGHMQDKGRPQNNPVDGKEQGEPVAVGTVLGYAGGGQEDRGCRGSSWGPRLYFELVEYVNGDYKQVNPYSCLPDTCSYYYLDKNSRQECVPTFDPSNRDNCLIEIKPRIGGSSIRGDYYWPSYSCVGNGRYAPEYVELTVNPFGRLNVTCYDIDNPPGARRCLSEIFYDPNGQVVPLFANQPKDQPDVRDFNCYLRFIRVHGDGTYQCGKIVAGVTNGEPNMDWNRPCDDISGLTIGEQSENRNMQQTLLQKITNSRDLVNYNKYVTVSAEYQVIGVDDSNYVEQAVKIDPNDEESFNPEETTSGLPIKPKKKNSDYYVDYMLIRNCDLAGMAVISSSCKKERMEYVDGLNVDMAPQKYTYLRLINEGSYQSCEYNLFDARKFYDNPGYFLSTYNYSRLAADRGQMFYSVNVGRDLERVYPQETYETVLDWNKDSIRRIWGCDDCKRGEIACSLGSAIKAKAAYTCCRELSRRLGWNLVNFDVCLNSPSRFGCDVCGYTSKVADYYGFNDLDDLRAIDNPAYQWKDGVWDYEPAKGGKNKLDYESGIPSLAVVNDSVKSIQTNISAYFVIDSKWKGPPFWAHLDNLGPTGSDIDWNQWLMPCAKEPPDNPQYRCDWKDPGTFEDTNDCEKLVKEDNPCDCPCGGCPCTGARPDGSPCSCNQPCYSYDWEDVSCDSYEEGPYVCDSRLARQAGTYCCWCCKPVDPDSGEEYDDGSYCGKGGVEITGEILKMDHYNYSGYAVEKAYDGVDCNDDLRIYTEANPAGGYPGITPAVLPDYDLVRDRYWKMNSTLNISSPYETAFECTRPGYCKNEYVGGRCDESPPREGDPFDRPASRQHDPCSTCKNWGDPFCPDECYNYDLRYYRQFNIDSVWANIFKITPEMNYMYTKLPPEYDLPDVQKLCIGQSAGRYQCQVRYVGYICTDLETSKDCIPGLVCTEQVGGSRRVCCPYDTYFSGECCRENDNHVCSDKDLECPLDKRIPVEKPASADEDPYDPSLYKGGLMKENQLGVKQDYKYDIGIGEKGCEHDIDCYTYMSYKNFGDQTSQYCSRPQIDFDTVRRDLLPNHCCPVNYEYDLTYRCCLPKENAVKTVEMHNFAYVFFKPDDAPPDKQQKQYWDMAYCEDKIKELNKKCTYEEGPCRLINRKGKALEESECAPGLVCMRSRYSVSNLSTGCCMPGQEWDGRNCVALNSTIGWNVTWTRGGVNTPFGPIIDQDGGGPIAVHAGGGAMIPTGEEAAGWGTSCSQDLRWQGGWPNQMCRTDRTTREILCKYCEAAWPYRCPPSPIWFEARNFGNIYKWSSPIDVCNGPFIGVDATLKAFKGVTVPVGLDCEGGDCNCGRDMDGGGDREDGIIDDGNLICPGESGSCNEMKQTSCKRSPLPYGAPVTHHACNKLKKGHGQFLAPVAYIRRTGGSMTVNPKDVNAAAIAPAACGSIQRKEVVSLNVDNDKYYQKPNNAAPLSWFDYEVWEYDKDRVALPDTPQTYRDHNRGRYDVLAQPARPYVLLRTDMLNNVQLRDRTRYLRVVMNYTVYNEIRRQPLVKQCMWLGCSRLEEIVVDYWTFHAWEEFDPSDCSIRKRATRAHYFQNVPPPCCCLTADKRPNRRNPFVWNTPETPPLTDPEDEEADRHNTWWCDSGSGFQECELYDELGNVIYYVRDYLYNKYANNCFCQYECWGCWHLNTNPAGTTTYPVTKPDDQTGEEMIVYENMTDLSVVTAEPYGDHIRVENPIGDGDAEIQTKVTGRLVYGYPEDHVPTPVPPSAADSGDIIDIYMPYQPGKTLTYAMGYLTFQSKDEESTRIMESGEEVGGSIDLFGGVRFRVVDPNLGSSRQIIDMYPKRYPITHDLTVLQSTLPNDYLPLSMLDRYLLRLNTVCAVRKSGDGTGDAPSSNIRKELDDRWAQDPFYFKWTLNPAKKYYNLYDQFTAHGTEYNLEQPILLIDRYNNLGNRITDSSEIICGNQFDERSPAIPLYRNFHDDEPRYYDYAALQIQPFDLEAGLEYAGFDPATMNNIYTITYSKPVQNVYARYAKDCENDPESKDKTYPECGNKKECPDMCSDLADVVCKGGKCDCEYKTTPVNYRDIFPVPRDVCRGSTVNKEPLTSGLTRCEGPPSKYKSFCAGGRYYAYWLDAFQYRYGWTGSYSGGHCEFLELNKCEPKEMPPNSYTLIFEPGSTLTKEDWETAQLTIYNNFRSFTIEPFKGKGPCDGDFGKSVVKRIDLAPDFTLEVEKPRPVQFKLLKKGEIYAANTGEKDKYGEPVTEYHLDLVLKAYDACVPGVLPDDKSGCNKVYVELNYPYNDRTDWYPVGAEIKAVHIEQGTDIVANIRCFDDRGFKQSKNYVSIVEIPPATTACDYLGQNFWIFLAAFAFVMSFAPFLGKLDPSTLDKLFKGKE